LATAPAALRSEAIIHPGVSPAGIFVAKRENGKTFDSGAASLQRGLQSCDGRRWR